MTLDQPLAVGGGPTPREREAALGAVPRTERKPSMTLGTIKSLRDKGFGFIAPDGAGERGSDVFFHRTAVDGDGFDQMREGQRVEFEIEPDPRDPSRQRAVNVRLEDAE